MVSSLIAAVPLPAAAQPRDPAGAEVLYRAGREAARRGDWPTACAKLAESQRLDPAPGTLLNLADCEEHRGQLAQAWQHFVQAETALPKGDARAAFAKTRADAVEKRLPHLSVRLEGGAPAGTKVLRDDQELGAASLGVSLPVDPGEHVVVARAEGRVDGRATVKLGEGDTREISVTIGASTAAPVPVPPAVPPPYVAPTAPPPATTPDTSSSSSPSKRPIVGYALLGAGGVGIAVGSAFGILALSKASTVKDACGPNYTTCTPSSVDAAHDGKTFTTVSTIGFVAGVALAGAGLYFLVSSPSSPNKTALTVAPNGAVVSGSF